MEYPESYNKLRFEEVFELTITECPETHKELIPITVIRKEWVYTESPLPSTCIQREPYRYYEYTYQTVTEKSTEDDNLGGLLAKL